MDINIEKVRKELINYFEDWFCYDDNLVTKNDIIKIIDDNIKEEDYHPIIIDGSVTIDKENIFGKSAKEIYDYLSSLEKEFGEGYFDEGWSGYEDNYLEYCYKRLENQDEVTYRLREKIEDKIKDFENKKEKEAKKAKEIAELEKRLAELKRK